MRTLSGVTARQRQKDVGAADRRWCRLWRDLSRFVRCGTLSLSVSVSLCLCLSFRSISLSLSPPHNSVAASGSISRHVRAERQDIHTADSFVRAQCYSYVGESARQEMERTLKEVRQHTRARDAATATATAAAAAAAAAAGCSSTGGLAPQEKKLTKTKAKKLAEKPENLGQIVLYPESKDIKADTAQALKDAATKEDGLLEELMKGLDDSGAQSTLLLSCALPTQPSADCSTWWCVRAV